MRDAIESFRDSIRKEAAGTLTCRGGKGARAEPPRAGHLTTVNSRAQRAPRLETPRCGLDALLFAE
jgi:hypothetical protein